MSPSKEIGQSQLQPAFPQTYQPTLRELLDAIALQTSSQWKYDPSSKYLKSDVAHGGAIDGLAMFEFTLTKRDKPFEVDLAEGWHAVDKGNWMMYVPPVFPVGMDIYELGSYSSEDKTRETALIKRIRTDVSLEWARRIKPDIKERDLGAAKVGSFDALFCEATISGRLNQRIRWRQWVFTVGDKCYLVISTIFPEFEDKIFPGVEKMLASFRIKD
ncbi:MAG TPA: hypothetical protein VN699_16800 [Pirellulales bacterium]|nr:hypothetical protein [Pirellulales bacterium]